MDVLDELYAVEQVKKVKARYFRCMDTKDWNGFQTVFAPDASLDTTEESPGSEVIHGAANIRRFVESSVSGIVTAHHGHTPEIEITSPTTATGIWAMHDHLQMSEGSALAEMGIKGMVGFGHYTETYVLIDGTWHIQTLVLTRLRRDFESA
jgi:SnoaL-like domain